MAINLVKGQTIDLRKNDKGESFDLSSVTIGLGWDVRKKSGGGFLSKLLGGGKEEEYDLDAIAFLLDANGKVANLGRTVQATNGRQGPHFMKAMSFSLIHKNIHLATFGLRVITGQEQAMGMMNKSL